MLFCVSDGTWGATNPSLPWGWKGGKTDSGVYDNVLADADPYSWKPTTVPVDPNEYQNEWLGSVCVFCLLCSKQYFAFQLSYGNLNIGLFRLSIFIESRQL